jgi:uncharacterized repeat protein (TIGR01451 family)
MTSTTTIAKATGRSPQRRRKGLLAGLVTVSAFAALIFAGPATALAAPVLAVSSTHNPSGSPAAVGTHAVYTVAVSNTGNAATSGNVTVDFAVPAGLEVTAVSDQAQKRYGTPAWSCTIAPDAQSTSCEGPELSGTALPIGPGEEACEVEFITCRLFVTLRVGLNTAFGPLTPTIEACGGGAAACATAPDGTLEVGPAGFRLTNFDGSVSKENGEPETQAGSHPFTAGTTFTLSSATDSGGFNGEGETYPLGGLRDASAELPPGLVGNPRAAATCSEAQLGTPTSKVNCPPESQVGVAIVYLFFIGAEASPYEVGVYNMEVPNGLPALFGFNVLGNVTQVYGKLRTGGDYGVTVLTKNAPETIPIGRIDFAFWGVPADPAHNAMRCPGTSGGFEGCSSSAPLQPFVSLPTSCVGPVRTFLEVTSWQGEADSSSFLSHDNTLPVPNPIGNDGCNAVDFSPTLQARPTTNVADAPSGLDVDLHVPQHENCEPGPPVSCENAEAHLEDTTVTLPEGLVINPSGANGLDGCSTAQFGLTTPIGATPIHTTPAPASCPDASKLGTVEVDTPLLEKPLNGAVYIANPYDNPFHSLLALYVAVNDEKTGIVVKLAGEVHADPNTGRLSATFRENPQLPFEDFKLHFSGGSGGALRTPAVCGNYSTTSSLTPWSAPDSGPPATPSDPWAISQASGGGACPTSEGSRPNAPSLDAGTVAPIAASYSPFVLNLRREDGSQQFAAVTLTLPPGLTGKLAGIPACSDAALAAAAAKSGQAERAAPSCPAASELGTVTAGAGAGPAPYYAPGKAYLAGPYKGAPLSMAIVTPATAGPFDLGTIVVRVALRVDPSTGQITAISDPIPQILQGIPLDVRSVQIRLDRSQFTRNGTSCNPLGISGQLVSSLGQAAQLANPFQLGECSSLGFKPKLAIRLLGGTKRGAHPALRAVVQMPEGGANIASAVVALPHSEFLDQGHIGTVCTRVQFAANQCPAASVYGHAMATSPLVDYAVEGPVYLRSSSNELPDLVMALHGPPAQPIEVDAAARIDSVKGGIRSSFEVVPDLPLSKVVLEMQGGKKGLLQNSTDICVGKHLASAEFDAQNGRVADFKPPLKAKCAKPRKKQKSHRGRAAR